MLTGNLKPATATLDTKRLTGTWTYSDVGGVSQYVLSANQTYRAHSVMIAPNFPRVEIETSGVYRMSGDTFVLTPQSTEAQGKPGALITVTGRYDSATDQLLLKPSTAVLFRVYNRSRSIAISTPPSRQTAVPDITLPGVLLVSLVASCIITGIVSWLTISRYKQSVTKAMKAQPLKGQATAYPSFDKSLKTDLLVRDSKLETPALLLDAKRRVQSLAFVYSLAGLTCTVILTVAFLLESRVRSLTAMFVFLTIFSWPIVLCWNQIAGWNAQTRRRANLLYAAVFSSLVFVSYLRSASNKPLQFFAAFALVSVLPTILIFTFSAPAVRSIGPCILVISTVCIMGAWSVMHLVQQNLAAAGLLSRWTDKIGISPVGAISFLFLFSAIAFFTFGALLLARVARNYTLNKVSDQSIRIDSIWLLFAVLEAIFVCSSSPSASGAGAVLAALGFPAYWIVRTLGLCWLRKRSGSSLDEISLLYLRRFRLDTRTERLFRSLTLYWRLIGDVRLIGGPDLARSTIQPHSLVNFIRGNSRSTFISSDGGLAQQLDHVSSRVDPDTRFRVTDFLCADDMWRQAVTALLKRRHVVVADFRGLTLENEGALYEIEQMLNFMPLESILILTDTRESTELVSRAIVLFRQSLPASSPNYKASRESLNVIFETPSAPETLSILKVLFSVASRTVISSAASCTAH